jgi:hypothetical protein
VTPPTKLRARHLAPAMLLLFTACSEDDDPPAQPAIQQVSFEAVPTPLFELGSLDVSLDAATYAQLEAFTAATRDEALPGIVAAVGLTERMLDTEMTPGGFALTTNPSLQTRLMASDAEVETFAAALGLVLSQWSVLVTDFAAVDGGTGFAVVSFDAERVDPALGQQFFEYAASVDQGLGGGYFAFGAEVIYLNLRGVDDEPYSGLTDDEFVALLADAAASFAPYRAEVQQSGEVAAIFVENDWAAAANGETYLDILDPLGDDVIADLEDLQAAHTDRFTAAADANDWR